MNQSKYPFGDAELAALRETVLREMSPKRFAHTAAVEDMVIRLEIGRASCRERV